MSGRFNARGDSELINACLDGDSEAWEALVRKYRRLVYSIPLKWGISRDDALEIFQAVWVDCFRKLSSLQNVESLQSWLIRIAVRKSHRFKQKLRVRVELPLSEEPDDSMPSEDPSADFIQRLHHEQLIRITMEKLSPRCRQVLQALFFEDPLPSYATIAARFGLSENSIGFTRDRCLERLGKLLEELGYEP